jgi:hypothetical protein
MSEVYDFTERRCYWWDMKSVGLLLKHYRVKEAIITGPNGSQRYVKASMVSRLWWFLTPWVTKRRRKQLG